MMKLHEDHKKLIIVIFFGIVSFMAVGTSSFIQRQRNISNSEASSISLEQYCHDGFYVIPGEDICSRAPNCGGFGYDELNNADKMPNPQKCMGDGASGREGKGCAGYVPACCYEVARTGDFTKCIGYWERLWCTKSQCDEARSNGATDSQCGGSCQCSHAHATYCGEGALPIPIAQRLGSNVPSNTQAPQATPTTKPQDTIAPRPPTATLKPNQPTPTTGSKPTLTPISTNQPTQPRPQETRYIEPSYIPPATNIPIPTNTPYQFPTIEIKSPKELAREVINPENIQKLNKGTEKTLNAPKEGLEIVKQADQKLEHTANSWIERIRIFIENLIN